MGNDCVASFMDMEQYAWPTRIPASSRRTFRAAGGLEGIGCLVYVSGTCRGGKHFCSLQDHLRWSGAVPGQFPDSKPQAGTMCRQSGLVACRCWVAGDSLQLHISNVPGRQRSDCVRHLGARLLRALTHLRAIRLGSGAPEAGNKKRKLRTACRAIQPDTVQAASSTALVCFGPRRHGVDNASL